LIGPIPTNLGLEIPMEYLELENSAYFRRWLLGLIFWDWLLELFGFIAVVEPGCRISECYGTHQWDTLWVSYGWMKFGDFELHPLIVHASWPRWECAIGFWNALWVAYNLVQSIFAYEGVLNVLTLNVDFLDWLLFRYSFKVSCRAWKWDSRMIWHTWMRHCMGEL
jgi:hypothetical protein